jgi:hypothetical protein
MNVLDYPSLLLIHCAATAFMVGVIWFVQVVHYPLFHRADPRGFPGFEADHQRRTSWVVMPPMLVEAGTLPWLWVQAPRDDRALWIVCSILLAGVWLSTFLLQVPRHRRLAGGYDRATVQGLVATNAIRTVLWTLKGLACIWLLARTSL